LKVARESGSGPLVAGKAFLGRASCFLKLGFESSAVVDAELALKEDPGITKWALMVKAKALKQMQEPGLALAVINQVLRPAVSGSAPSLSEEKLCACRKERAELVKLVEELNARGEGIKEQEKKQQEANGSERRRCLEVVGQMFHRQLGVLSVLQAREAQAGVLGEGLQAAGLGGLLSGQTRVTPWEVDPALAALKASQSMATRKAPGVYCASPVRSSHNQAPQTSYASTRPNPSLEEPSSLISYQPSSPRVRPSQQLSAMRPASSYGKRGASGNHSCSTRPTSAHARLYQGPQAFNVQNGSAHALSIREAVHRPDESGFIPYNLYIE